MRLTDLLSPERVGIQREDAGFNKEAAIKRLAELIGQRPGVSVREVEQALLDREQLQSTGIGEGVAIPHGALPQLTEQVAALLIVPAGVEFQAIDDAAVSILFGVITPKRATGEHLKTLARVSRLLRNKDFRSRLIHAPDPQAVFDLIQTEEGSTPTLPTDRSSERDIATKPQDPGGAEKKQGAS